MLTWLYKRILNRFDLSQTQKEDLILKLHSDKICAGPFTSNGKMCPNTMALSIKIKKQEIEKKEIKYLFKRYGVLRIELWLFYILFDIPAMLSNRIMIYLKEKLIKAIDV